jgi:hypothetical protein
MEFTIHKRSVSKEHSTLSITSKKYDVDGDGKLDHAEQTMRDMDIDNHGYLTNEKVYTRSCWSR